jgi:Asp-tRNA(Asn)/Glu-tRNA(Gln) amidotransferase A subunit family amidase
MLGLQLHAAQFDAGEASILELQIALSSGATSSVGLVEYFLARIERYDQAGPGLNSMAYVNPAALDEAAALDRERGESGARGPLHGIPMVVKDNYETRGMPTGAGSAVLEGFAPDRDAELVARLRAAGAIILGKTNMHEFAYGIESVGSAFGLTRNPYDPSRNPGGSSGGTGSAVAANFAVAGLGSDTCGSIRVPAAHNSLVGLRGTQGASSRVGIIPLSSTQDIGGPLARNVTDLALILDALVGFDPHDPQTAAGIGKFENGMTASLNPDSLRGARLGVVKELHSTGPEDEEVAAVFDAAMAQIRAMGAEVIDVSIPEMTGQFTEVFDGFYVVVHDFGTDIDRYLAGRPGAPVSDLQAILASGKVHAKVVERLQWSADAQNDPPEIYYRELSKRERLRTVIYSLMGRQRLDALAYPTIRRKAALVGEEQPGDNCLLAAISGLPAITVPAGFTADGMPVGLELLGRAWEDAQLLGLAYAFEQATRHRRPPGATP